jgi:exo-1,4-beta-D-glucosaminidase
MTTLQKIACLLSAALVFTAAGFSENNPENSQALRQGWFVQSSEKAAAEGDEISKPGFSIGKWHPAMVPGTVLGALVRDKVYRDIYVGKNFELIPAEPFKDSWWYRTEFFLLEDAAHNIIRLEFDGINYRANIWLNGKLLAGADKIAGAFRRFAFDVTGLAKTGVKNALAVEVFPPQPGDLTLGFVDWNPKPPDKNMGLWREVRLMRTGDISLHFPFVKSKVDLDTFKEARLEISAEVRNNSQTKVAGVLCGQVESVVFSRSVELGPRETKLVKFSPDDTPELVIKNPRLWWTHDFGSPELYDLHLSFKTGSAVSDSKHVRFGIREVSDYFNEEGHRGYKLNGKKILIRGGGWVDELLLDTQYRKLEAEVKYARHMNLNTLRLEGFWGENEDLYNLCDENGIFLMAGWSCQWEWEDYFGKPTDDFGGLKSPEDIKLAAQSWKDQVKWLRNHPSIFVWLMGSDLLPRPALEKEFIQVLTVDDPTRPSLISAGGKVSTLTGKSGVKMNGPYDYVPPNYWYVDIKNGGAFGFNTETGPGPQVPPVESVKKFILAKDLWPINDVWSYHCARGEFNTLDRYNEAMTKRLGAPQSLEEYCLKAQFLNYEGMRAMFEAFGANKFTATGIIQWMYNSAWPKLWWQLYDYYLMPTGAFYGARKACEPVHILYNYGKGEIAIVNNTLSGQDDLRAAIRVSNFDLTDKFSKELTVSLAPNESQRIFTLPDLPGLSKAYFVDLRLFDKNGAPVSSNFYCLSTKPDVLDEAKTEWFVTPAKDYADLTELNILPQVQLKASHRFTKEGGKDVIIVDLENPASQLAFMIELRLLKDKSGVSVLPIFWEDNYFSLLPGEKRTLRGTFSAEDLGGEKPVLKISGWSVK